MDKDPMSPPPNEQIPPTQPRSKAKQPRSFNKHAYRAWVWIIVAVCALLTLIGLASVGDPSSAENQMAVAELTKSSNDSRAQGAPQQQVVNGWFTTDALSTISQQLSGIHEAGRYTSRLYFLALIASLGVAADIIGRSFGAQHNARLAQAAQTSKSTDISL